VTQESLPTRLGLRHGEPLHLQDLADAGPDAVFIVNDEDLTLFVFLSVAAGRGSCLFLDHLQELPGDRRLVEEGVQLGPLLESFHLPIETAARRGGDPREHDQRSGTSLNWSSLRIL